MPFTNKADKCSALTLAWNVNSMCWKIYRKKHYKRALNKTLFGKQKRFLILRDPKNMGKNVKPNFATICQHSYSIQFSKKTSLNLFIFQDSHRSVEPSLECIGFEYLVPVCYIPV